MRGDPPRWLETKTLPSELRRELLAYASEGPSSERRARMRAELIQRMDASGSVRTLTRGLTTKLMFALGVGALLAGALLAVLTPHEVRERLPGSTELAAPRIEVAAASAPRAPGPGGVQPQLGTSARASERPVEVESAEAWPAPSDSTPERRRTLASPKPGGAGLVRRELSLAARESRASAPQESVRAAAVSEPRPLAEPLAELALLAQARRALLVAPERAFALAEEHAHLYPHGTFAEEREVLAIESLLRLSLKTQAEGRVRAFERRFPSSTHRAHLMQLVSGD